MPDPELLDDEQGNTDVVDETIQDESGTTDEGTGTDTEVVEYTDFAVPEGQSFDEEVLGEFKESAAAMGLKQEDAQKFVDMGLKLAGKTGQAVLEQQASMLAEQREQWVSALKSDKEFGGEKFGATVDEARRVLKTYGNEDLVTVLEESGYGDHPALIKMLAKLGKALGEDESVDGKAAAGAKDVSEKSMAEVLYPNE